MGTASGCGTTTTSFVLPVKTGIHGGVRRWGVRSYVEPVRSRRCAQQPLPHHGYRIGVRYDDYLLRLTGENRYPWWGAEVGGTLLRRRSVVEGAPSNPYPTMGTASGCGTTTTSFVLPVKTGIHGGVRRWGVRSYVEPVRSRRCAQQPLPHHGYRIGVRYDESRDRLARDDITGRTR